MRDRSKPKIAKPDLHIGGLDIREVAGCSCLRLRKTTRQVTQIYEHHLQGAQLSIGQFGVLGQLFGSFATTGGGLPVGSLADRLGVDPTTLKRTLDPLVKNGLVEVRPGATDRRVRVIQISKAGRARLETAIPLWMQAQQDLGDILEDQTKRELDALMDRAFDRLLARP